MKEVLRDLIKLILRENDPRIHVCRGCHQTRRTIWVVTRSFEGELCMACIAAIGQAVAEGDKEEVVT